MRIRLGCSTYYMRHSQSLLSYPSPMSILSPRGIDRNSDFIIYRWQMTFQASDHKERKFLDLNNDKEVHIHSTYTKGRAWLKYFGLSNSICT